MLSLRSGSIVEGYDLAVPLVLKGRFDRFGARLKLPESVPQFGDRVYAFYRLLWFAAFALALIGPSGGIYQRLTNPADNSILMLGSRLGVALAEDDATHIRFPVGREAVAAGIKSGDKLVAIDGRAPFIRPVAPHTASLQ